MSTNPTQRRLSAILAADVVGYVRAVADASDRVTIHEYARTYEDRPLHYLIITSPENHARIESIRENNLKLADPSLPAAEASDLISSQPVIPALSRKPGPPM